MRGTKAKALRRKVYGKGNSSPNFRSYFRDGKTGTIHAGPRRKEYQELKKRGSI